MKKLSDYCDNKESLPKELWDIPVEIDTLADEWDFTFSRDGYIILLPSENYKLTGEEIKRIEGLDYRFNTKSTTLDVYLSGASIPACLNESKVITNPKFTEMTYSSTTNCFFAPEGHKFTDEELEDAFKERQKYLDKHVYKYLDDDDEPEK